MQYIPRLENEFDHRLHDRFRQSYQLGRAFAWQAALEVVTPLFQVPDLQAESFYPLYLSYFGWLKLLCGHQDGIQYCRAAARKEILRTEVFANLSLAELLVKNRQNALVALQYGLRLNPRSANLRFIAFHMGKRRAPLVDFLHRDHLINRLLGKFTYKKSAIFFG